MPGLLVTGGNSAICRQLVGFSDVYQLSRNECDMANPAAIDSHAALFERSERIILAHGALGLEPRRSMQINLLSFVAICEHALTRNPYARIVVIGSESATKGSLDVPYWLSKAALHSYVRERRLSKHQQLVAVAPSAIKGTGMTAVKGADVEQMLTLAHPKRRLADPDEVAKLIQFLLLTDRGYITNTVVEINGGKFSRAMPQ